MFPGVLPCRAAAAAAQCVLLVTIEVVDVRVLFRPLSTASSFARGGFMCAEADRVSRCVPVRVDADVFRSAWCSAVDAR